MSESENTSEKPNLLQVCAAGIATKTAEILSKKNAKIAMELRDNHNWTPLHHAVNSNAIDCVRILLSQITIKQIRYESWEGETALHLACSKLDIHSEIVKILLEKDPELVLYVNNEFVSPLQKANENQRLDVIKLLINYGAPINYVDLDEEPATFYAIRSNNPEIIMYLITLPDCDLHHKNHNNIDITFLYALRNFDRNLFILDNDEFDHNDYFPKIRNNLILQTIAQLRNYSDPLKCIYFTDFYNTFLESLKLYHVKSHLYFLPVFCHAFKDALGEFKVNLLNETINVNYRRTFIEQMKPIFTPSNWPQPSHIKDWLYFDMLYDIFAMNLSVFEELFYSLMYDGITWYGREKEFWKFITKFIFYPGYKSCEFIVKQLITFTKYFIAFGLCMDNIVELFKNNICLDESNEELCNGENCLACIYRLYVFLPFLTTTEFDYSDYANLTDKVPMLKSLCRDFIRSHLFSQSHDSTGDDQCKNEHIKLWRLTKIAEEIPRTVNNYLRFNKYDVEMK